jgi:hypothetical protein
VHLRAADPLRDLRLGQVPGEAQGDHAQFPLGQLGQQRAQRLDVLDPAVAGFCAAQHRGERYVVVGRADRRVDRQWSRRVVGGQGFVDVLRGAAQVFGQIGRGRQAAQLLGQLAGGRPDVEA